LRQPLGGKSVVAVHEQCLLLMHNSRRTESPRRLPRFRFTVNCRNGSW
jgi:hypothetical protein